MSAHEQLTCPDCGAPMHLKRYPDRKPRYQCSRIMQGCGGNHTAHEDGTPMGIPADYETRQTRVRAHRAFDQMVSDGLFTSRSAAYRWIQKAMGMNRGQAHIGRFTKEQCELLIALIGDFEDARALRRRRRRSA